MNKKDLSERDICTKFITPALLQAGWQQTQFREEVPLTDGRVMVRGKLAARNKDPNAKGGPKRADYVLYACPGVPLAVVEAKQNNFSIGQRLASRECVLGLRTLPGLHGDAAGLSCRGGGNSVVGNEF